MPCPRPRVKCAHLFNTCALPVLRAFVQCRSGECGSKCHNKTWVAPLGDRNPELYSGTEPFMTNRRHGTAGQTLTQTLTSCMAPPAHHPLFLRTSTDTRSLP